MRLCELFKTPNMGKTWGKACQRPIAFPNLLFARHGYNLPGASPE